MNRSLRYVLSLCGLESEARYAVKIHEEGYEHFICCWTIFEYSQQVGFEYDGRNISCMEREGGGRI